MQALQDILYFSNYAHTRRDDDYFIQCTYGKNILMIVQ